MSGSQAIDREVVGRASNPLTGFGRRCRLVCRVAIALTIMSVGSVLMLLAALATLFRARRFYAEVIGVGAARAVLRVFGIRLVVHRAGPFPDRQTVFVSNETSTLDVVVLAALGLPNTRFFMSGFARKYLPLGLMGYLTGNFWTVPQSLPERRVRIFQRAERVLRRTGASVYLSPEGGRNTTGVIGPFNKGAFHLATNLRAPIVPFYLATPPQSSPGMGFDARPGVVQVYFQPALPTEDWKLADLDQNRLRVWELFRALHEQLRPQ
jgi:1-acyl-sn-glycerol-3-phosphate acyltransferase